MSRPVITILPFEPEHYAALPVRVEQRDELARMGQVACRAAELGPAFTAAELDDTGGIARVLACAGLCETTPPSDEGGGYATAWAAFRDDLRPAEWSTVTAAIRAVVEGSEYSRIDMMVRCDFPAAIRYAEALGFKPDSLIYARSGCAAQPAAAPPTGDKWSEV